MNPPGDAMAKRNSSLKKSPRNRNPQHDAETPMESEEAADEIESKAERKNTRPWGWAVSAILIAVSTAIIGYAGYLLWAM